MNAGRRLCVTRGILKVLVIGAGNGRAPKEPGTLTISVFRVGLCFL